MRETELEDLKKRRKRQQHCPTGRQICRGSWLAPLQSKSKLAEDPELSRSVLRASDKGFLPLRLGDYLQLLEWTGRHDGKITAAKIPSSLQLTLHPLGIDASMWCDLVWN